MEEDDEIQSQQSPETGSPALSASPPRPNGRITVTVASAPPPPQSQAQPTQHKTLTLALPIQPRNNGGGSGSGGGGREDCWSEGATSVLIEAWGDRYLELSRGNLKQKHWKEVADIVSTREDYTKTPKTDIQCKNRIDTVKKKYKLEKQKIAAGAGPSKWPFFERLDHLIGPTAKIPGVVMNNTPPAATQKVPLGIPVGIGVRYNNNQPKPLQVVLKNSGQRILHQEQQQQFRKRDVGLGLGLELESDSEADSMDSLPPPLPRPPKRARNRMMVMGKVEESGKTRGGGEGGGWGNAVKELTQAILRFGEAYEQAESAKLQQVVDMEKQRMKFAKELELQRMQFFMNTQMEISQLRRKSGGGSGSNHHSNNNNNNSDCSN